MQKTTMERFVFVILLIIIFLFLSPILSQNLAVASRENETASLSSAGYKQLRSTLFALIDKQNPTVAIDKLREEMKNNPGVLASCHPMLHDLGQHSYEKYQDFAVAMKYQDAICVSGYIHGVVEAYATNSKRPVEAFYRLCDKYKAGSTSSWDCYHGVGHGFMYFTGNNLPISLLNCHAFQSDFAVSSCISGVFMENFSADNVYHPSKYLNTTSPLASCTQNGFSYKECYRYAPIYFLRFHQYQFSDGLKWCNLAPFMYRSYCYETIGGYIAKYNYTNPSRAETLCESQGILVAPSCVIGMASWSLSYFNEVKNTDKLCSRLNILDRFYCAFAESSYKRLFKL